MSVKITHILSPEEKERMDEDAISKGFYRDDPRIFLPGMAWCMPWYFDPTGERERMGKHVMIRSADEGEPGFLSIHYWNDWADKRAPICVICPNGERWEIDRKSANGDGWKVSGDLPAITCTPSIVVPGYHGFLQKGQFTLDLEGRGPNGIMRKDML